MTKRMVIPLAMHIVIRMVVVMRVVMCMTRVEGKTALRRAVQHFVHEP